LQCGDGVLASLLMLLAASAAPTAGAMSAPGFELWTGASSLLVLSPVSGRASFALETAAQGPITPAWRWVGGARLGFGPLSPEAFARLAVTPRWHDWMPSAGLELGLSARAGHDSGGALLAEERALSRRDLVPAYVALHAAPLCFQLFGRIRVSVLELQTGTYLSPFGRYVRLQVGLLSAGIAL
jgi:hypothetical protein